MEQKWLRCAGFVLTRSDVQANTLVMSRPVCRTFVSYSGPNTNKTKYTGLCNQI